MSMKTRRGSCVDLVILKYARTWWADRPRYHLRHSSGVSSGSGFRTFLRLPSKTACITFLHAFRIQIGSKRWSWITSIVSRMRYRS